MTTISSRLFQPFIDEKWNCWKENISMTVSNPGNEFREQETKVNAKTKNLADLHMNYIDKCEVI